MWPVEIALTGFYDTRANPNNDDIEDASLFMSWYWHSKSAILVILQRQYSIAEDGFDTICSICGKIDTIATSRTMAICSDTVLPNLFHKEVQQCAMFRACEDCRAWIDEQVWRSVRPKYRAIDMLKIGLLPEIARIIFEMFLLI